MSEKETFRNTSIFSFFTVISRILGLGRDIMKAFAFGTGLMAVAFDIAFRLPNMLRNLVAEGALQQSFVPVYDNYRSDSATGMTERRVSGIVLTLFFFLLTLLSVAAWYSLPYLIPYLIHDAGADTELTALTIDLARILFPYIMLISLSSIYMAIQYSHGIFWAASLGPALLNLVILSLFALYLVTDSAADSRRDVYVFSFVTLTAALVQLLFQAYRVKKIGVSPKFSVRFRHPVVKDLFFMMLPAVFGAAVQEIGQIIDIFLATMLRDEVPGAVAALTYSHRLIHLPIGVFGVAVATASLPRLSRLFRSEKFKEFSNTVVSSYNLNLYLLLPSAAGLVIIAEPLTGLIFERGEFTRESTLITAHALIFYALGIPAYAQQKLFMSAYYAGRNSRTPAVITALVLVLNVSFSLALMPYLQHGGLALGSAAAAYCGSIIYVILLLRRRVLNLKMLLNFRLLRLLLMNALLSAALYAISRLLDNSVYAVQVTVTVTAGIVIYLLLSYLFRATEFRIFKEIILNRFSRKQ